ncbi:MAG: FHA domain-containing protein [Gammaproteobacteria bacterium]
MTNKNDDPADITVFAKPRTDHFGRGKARLVCLDESLDASLKDLEIPLEGNEQTVGRSQKNTVCVRYSELSREHARLFLRGDTWVVEDLDSLNGVFVNDEQVKQSDLKEDDVVVIGNIPFRYMVERPKPASAPAAKREPAAAHKQRASAEPAAPLTPEPPAKPKTPPRAAQGAKGTMYVGHADIVESLARPGEAAEQREERAPRPRESEKKVDATPATPAARPAGKAPGAKKRPLLRLLFAAVAAGSLAVGGYYYLQHKSAQEVNAIVLDYQGEFDAFIDNYESENQRLSKENLDTELAEVRQIAARVDLAAKQYPDNSSFKALQARLSFLEFERRLNDRLLDGSIDGAQNLVVRTRDTVQSLLRAGADWKGADRRKIESVLELIELGSVITKFKLFRQRFPDPSNPGAFTPSSLDMREMQMLKQTLARKKEAHQLPLSVTYSYFQRMLNEVDEHDIRLVNRWREALKKAQGS